MQSLKDTLKMFEVRKVETKHRTRRGELISSFLQELNPPRIESGYAPYSYPRLAKMVSHLDDHDLATFLASAREARNFGSFFHWSLKVINR